MEKKDNNWTQAANADGSEVREGTSSLDQLNQSNEKRELGNWSDAEKKGNGDYGSEEGRSDAGVTGGETAISRPFGGGSHEVEALAKENDNDDVQPAGALPI